MTPWTAALPGSSVCGVSWARILSPVAISFSRAPSPPRAWESDTTEQLDNKFSLQNVTTLPTSTSTNSVSILPWIILIALAVNYFNRYTTATALTFFPTTSLNYVLCSPWTRNLQEIRPPASELCLTGRPGTCFLHQFPWCRLNLHLISIISYWRWGEEGNWCLLSTSGSSRLASFFLVCAPMHLHIQLWPPLCNHMDCSPQGFSVHGILQTRILEWAVISFSRGSSRPRHWTWVSCVFCIERQILYRCATWEAHPYIHEVVTFISQAMKWVHVWNICITLWTSVNLANKHWDSNSDKSGANFHTLSIPCYLEVMHYHFSLASLGSQNDCLAGSERLCFRSGEGGKTLRPYFTYKI